MSKIKDRAIDRMNAGYRVDVLQNGHWICPIGNTYFPGDDNFRVASRQCDGYTANKISSRIWNMERNRAIVTTYIP